MGASADAGLCAFSQLGGLITDSGDMGKGSCLKEGSTAFSPANGRIEGKRA